MPARLPPANTPALLLALAAAATIAGVASATGSGRAHRLANLPDSLPAMRVELPPEGAIERFDFDARAQVATTGRRAFLFVGTGRATLVDGRQVEIRVKQRLHPRRDRSRFFVRFLRSDSPTAPQILGRSSLRLRTADAHEQSGSSQTIERFRLRVWERGSRGRRVMQRRSRPDGVELSLGTAGPAPGPSMFEWTTFEAASDTRRIYVSATAGDDANDGLTESSPVRSLARGASLLRDGSADWLLLRAGDTFPDQEISIRNKSGRSPANPLRVSSYGDGPRPVLENSRLYTGLTVNNLAIDSLRFVRTREESAPVAAVFTLHGGDFFLIENCHFERYGSNLSVQGFDGPLTDFRIRGCVVVDSYSTQKHSQGLFLNNVNGVLVEGCVFDHNGWNEDIAEAEATIFNHNMYIHPSCSDVTVRDTITANGSSHGLSQPSGGLCEDNLFLRNGVALGFATGGTVRRNAFVDGRDTDSNPRGFGIWLERIDGANVHDNVLVNQTSGSQSVAIQIDRNFTGVSLHDNVVYDWASDAGAAIGLYVPGAASGQNEIRDNVIRQPRGDLVVISSPESAQMLSLTGGVYFSPASPSTWFRFGGAQLDLAGWTAASGETSPSGIAPQFVDPGRSIESYAASLGLAPNVSAFLSAARRQQRGAWSDNLSASRASAYVRAGYARD